MVHCRAVRGIEQCHQLDLQPISDHCDKANEQPYFSDPKCDMLGLTNL